MVYADLHVHTTHSDGTLEMDDLPSAADRADVDVVGVTDHDRIHPDLDAPVVTLEETTVIRGIELRVETDVQRVDLLAYAVTPTPPLERELERIQQDRVERGRAIVACVEDRLDVDLDVPLEAGVGRPHIARAVLAQSDSPYESVGSVFEELIGDGDPCYVARDVTDFEDGVALLRESSPLVSLAHPFRYDDPDAALGLCERLDGVETSYPYDRDAGRDDGGDRDDRLHGAIETYDLLETGGSDAHGRSLGAAGLSRQEYGRLEPLLPTP